MDLESFPNEILAEIFQYLPFKQTLQVASLCKRFKDIIRQSRFYGKLQVPHSPAKLTAFKKTFQNATQYPFKEIIVLDCVSIPHLQSVLSFCNRESVKRVEVYFASERFSSQLRWINEFPNLTELQFHYDCSITSDDIDLAEFEEMTCLKTLKAGNIIESLDFIEKLLVKLPNLKRILLELGCSIPFYEQHGDEEANRIIALAGRVDELNLSFSDEKFRPDDQVSSYRGLIAVRHPNLWISHIGIILESLPLDLVSQFSSVHGQYVTHLDLNVAGHLQDDTFVRITNCFPNLERLVVEDITQHSTKFLMDDLEKFSKLRSLKVSFFPVTDIRQTPVTFYLEKKSQPALKLLEELILDLAFGVLLHPRSLNCIIARSPNLTSLKLNLPHICLGDVRNILTNATALRQLHITGQLHHDNSYPEFGNITTTLEDLCLQGMRICSNELVQELAELRNLRILKLNLSDNIMEINVQQVLERNPFIEILHIRGGKISDNTVIVIRDKLKYLKKLELKVCGKGLTTGSIKLLKDYYKNCEVTYEEGFRSGISEGNLLRMR